MERNPNAQCRAVAQRAAEEQAPQVHSDVNGSPSPQQQAGSSAVELDCRQQQLATAVLQEMVPALFPVLPDKVTGLQGPVVEMRKVSNAVVDVKVTFGFQASFGSRLQEAPGQLPDGQGGTTQALLPLSQLKELAGGCTSPSSLAGSSRSAPVIIEQHEGEGGTVSATQPSAVVVCPSDAPVVEAARPAAGPELGAEPTSLGPASRLHLALPQSPFAALRDQPWSRPANGTLQAQDSQQLTADVVMADMFHRQPPVQEALQGPVDTAISNGQALVQAVALPVVPSPVLQDSNQWLLDSSRLRIGRRIAVGGFAEVFVGQYEGTLVAVKRLYATDRDTVSNFVHEVRTLAQLRHPNLILWMGYTLQPEPCIITEFMSRGSLFQLLRSRRAAGAAPDQRLAAAVASSVARGMAYLHSRNPPILHLDLKSPNILIDDKWRIKIADFGLSTVKQHSYVSSGHGGGTPEWNAPEVLRCERYDERADVYSYGVVLWEVLTGQVPWEDLQSTQVVGAVGYAGKSLPEPTEGDPVLRGLCTACISHDPLARPTFATIVQVLDERYGGSARWLEGASSTCGPLLLGDGQAAAVGGGGPGEPSPVPQSPALLALPSPPVLPALPPPPARLALPAPDSHGCVPPQKAEFCRNGSGQQELSGCQQQQRRQEERQQPAQGCELQEHCGQSEQVGMAVDAAPVPGPAALHLPSIATQPSSARSLLQQQQSGQLSGRGCAESPANRRRDRSPCSRVSSDDPPPVIARRADGGKAPSPRQSQHLWLDRCPELGRASSGDEGCGGASPASLGPSSPWTRASMSGMVSGGSLNLSGTCTVTGLPAKLRHRRTGSGSTFLCHSSARAARVAPSILASSFPALPASVQEQAEAVACSPLPARSSAAPNFQAARSDSTQQTAGYSTADLQGALAGQLSARQGSEQDQQRSVAGKGSPNGAEAHAVGDAGAACGAGAAGDDCMEHDHVYYGETLEPCKASAPDAGSRGTASAQGVLMPAADARDAVAAAQGAAEDLVPCSFSKWQNWQNQQPPSPWLQQRHDSQLPRATASPLGRMAALGAMAAGQAGFAQPTNAHGGSVPQDWAGQQGDDRGVDSAKPEGSPVGRLGVPSVPRSVPQQRWQSPLAHAITDPEGSEGPASLSAWHPESTSLCQRHRSDMAGVSPPLLPGLSAPGSSLHDHDSVHMPSRLAHGHVASSGALAPGSTSAARRAGPPGAGAQHARDAGVPWVGRPLPSVSCQSSHDDRARFEFDVASAGGRAADGDRGSSGGSTPASLSHWQMSPHAPPAQLQHRAARGSSNFDLSLSTGMDVCRAGSSLSPFATAFVQQHSAAAPASHWHCPGGSTSAPGHALLPGAAAHAGSGAAVHAWAGAPAVEFSLLPPCASTTSVGTSAGCVPAPESLRPSGVEAGRLAHNGGIRFSGSGGHPKGTVCGQDATVDGTGRFYSVGAGCSSAGSWGMDTGMDDDDDDDDKVVSSPPSPDMTGITSALSPELQHLMQQATAANNYRWGRFKVTDFSLPRQPQAGVVPGAIAAAAGGSPCGTRSSAGLSPCSSLEAGDLGGGLAAAAQLTGQGMRAHSCSNDGSGGGAESDRDAGLVRSRSTTTMYRKGRFFVSRTTTQHMVDEASSENDVELNSADGQQGTAVGSEPCPPARDSVHALRAASSPASCAAAAAAVAAGPSGLPPLPPSASPRTNGQAKGRSMHKLLLQQQQQQSEQQQQQQQQQVPGPPQLRVSQPLEAVVRFQPQPQERHYHAGRFDVHEVQSAVRVDAWGSGLASAASAPSAAIPEACLKPARRSSETQAGEGPVAAAAASTAMCTAGGGSHLMDAHKRNLQQLVPPPPSAAQCSAASFRPAPAPLPVPLTPGTRVGRFLVVDVPGTAPPPSTTPSSEASPASGARTRAVSSEGGSFAPTPTGTSRVTAEKVGGALGSAVASPCLASPAAASAAGSPNIPQATNRGRFKVWDS